MTIAELEINIRDNAKTSSTSLKEFANDLREVKSASTEAKGGLEGLANVNPNVNNLRNQVSRLNTALKPLASTLKQIQDGLEALGRRGTKSALRESVQNTSQLQGKVTEATKGTVGTDTSLSDKAAIAIGQSTVATDTAIKEAVKDTEKLVEKTKEAKKESLDLGKALKGLHITKLLGQFGKLLKLKILRTIVSNLLKGFSEGLENVYNWASITGNQFKASMDKISTSLNYAKNSIGAMVAPLVNMLAPVLDWIVDKFVAVINIINEFFALLGGQATYIRALKAPVQWGEGVSNAMGGAAGAAKDLKDALDVLPFDELNQLSAPSDSGSGGGGGGGSAGGADYGSMFEEAEISKATGFAGLLRDNFTEVLSLVTGIGTAIAAWKISEAFNLGLSKLATVGVGVMAAGITLEVTAGYKLGKEGIMGEDGINWKGLLETILGGAMAVVGAGLAFGSTGVLLSIPLVIALGMTSIIKGAKDASIERLSQTVWWQDLEASIDNAKSKVQAMNDGWSKSKQLTKEYADTMHKIGIAKTLLDDIETLNSKTDLSAQDSRLLQGYISALNDLSLDGISLTFDELTGTVTEDVETMKGKLDELMKKTTEAYYYERLNNALSGYTENQVNSDIARQEIANLQSDYADELAYYQKYMNSDFITQFIMGLSPGNMDKIQTGKEALTAITENINVIRTADLANKDYIDSIKTITQVMKEQGMEVPDLTYLLGELGDAQDEVNESVDSYSDSANKQVNVGNLMKTALQKTVTALNSVTESAKSATTEAGNINTTMQNVGVGVDFSSITTRFKNGFLNAGISKIGENVKSDIESGINKTGTNLDYAGIKDLINTKLKGQKWAPTGKGIGELIGKALSTGLSISEIYNACYSRLGVVFNDSGWANLGWGVGKAIGGGITNAIAQLINAYTMKVSYTVNGQSRTETIYTEAWWIEHYGAYANGGFPKAGSLFIAGEEMGNTEFLGNINGKTAVAPQDDIVTAVQRGVVQALGNGGNETTQVNVYMDSQKVASAVAKGNRMMNRRLNVSVS